MGAFSEPLTLNFDDGWDDCRTAHVEDAHRGGPVMTQGAGHLQPRPLEPTRMLSQPPRCCLRVPLVYCAGVEQERAAHRLDLGPMGVAEHDGVHINKPPSQVTRQAGMWAVAAKAQGPEQRLRLLDQPAAIAVDDD